VRTCYYNQRTFQLKINAMKNKTFKIILKSVLSLLLVVVIALASYVAYLFIDYDRIEDDIALNITDNTHAFVPIEKELKIVSYNIGFCAYTQDFSFFMDGGEMSRAKSKESVNEVLDGIDTLLKKEDAEIVLLQEVDEDADRSHHVDERAFLTKSATDYDCVFATNFDSAYLFYPFNKPHGKSLSGLLTLSKFDIYESTRRSLPVETSVMKIVDLDRCYSVSRLKTQSDKELILYTVHLSAYTSDGTIATEQLKMLTDDMEAEYSKGNYIICGGDFNKDLLQNSGEIFGVSGEEYTWAQAFPTQTLEGTGLSLVAPFNKENPVATCRNTDEAYKEEGQFNVTLDGFIVSDNISVSHSDVIDTKFMYSDHDPVYMNFTLKK